MPAVFFPWLSCVTLRTARCASRKSLIADRTSSLIKRIVETNGASYRKDANVFSRARSWNCKGKSETGFECTRVLRCDPDG